MGKELAVNNAKAETGMSLKSPVPVLKVLMTYFMIGLLLRWPETAAQAARIALDQWYCSVAPALLPFMMLMPMITSFEAVYMYEKMLGRTAQMLFGLPGSAAPAIIIGMIAGSPAGVIAACKAAERAKMGNGQLVRIAGCACGLSPAFLITGIGLGMAGDAAVGAMLMRTQVCTQIIMLLATKKLNHGKMIEETEKEGNAAGEAVLPIINVAGYMAFFSVLSALILKVTGRGLFRYVICLLEVTAGAGLIAKETMEIPIKMIILAGLCGFGGLSIFLQNMKFLSKHGISGGVFFKWKSACAAVSMAVMYAQMHIMGPDTTILRVNYMIPATFFAVLLVVPSVLRIKKSIS